VRKVPDVIIGSGVLSDGEWARIQPLLPSSTGRRGHPFRDHRQVVEGMVYRLRAGVPWRELPSRFGPWQTVWKRYHRFCADVTLALILAGLQAEAELAQSARSPTGQAGPSRRPEMAPPGPGWTGPLQTAPRGRPLSHHNSVPAALNPVAAYQRGAAAAAADLDVRLDPSTGCGNGSSDAADPRRTSGTTAAGRLVPARTGAAKLLRPAVSVTPRDCR